MICSIITLTVRRIRSNMVDMFNDDGRPRFTGPICFHCNKCIDAAFETVIDCGRETYCSLLCATLVATHDHGENCGDPECEPDDMVLSLPSAESTTEREVA